jgi:hypothetical protein
MLKTLKRSQGLHNRLQNLEYAGVDRHPHCLYHIAEVKAVG